MPKTPDIVEELREISVCVPNVDGPVADYLNALNENGTAMKAANEIERLRSDLASRNEHLMTLAARATKAEREVARLQAIMLDDTERERWIVEWDQTQLFPHFRSTRDPKPRTEWEMIAVLDDERHALRVCEIAHELLVRREAMKLERKEDDTDGP